MIFMSAHSNSAGTVLTVAGATEGDRRLRESEYQNYVVSGDAHEIAETLNRRSGVRILKLIAADWGLVVGRFSSGHLPPDAFEIQVVTPDQQKAAARLTIEERDYIYAAEFDRNEVFKAIVERYKEARTMKEKGRITRIRADLDALSSSPQSEGRPTRESPAE